MISLIAASAISWIATVSILGVVVQQSEPVSQEKCNEIIEDMENRIEKVSQGTGLVRFRQKYIVNVSDIELECNKQMSGEL